jgi:hypothetical protein
MVDNKSRTASRFFLMTPLPATIGCTNADIIDISVAGARLQLTEELAVRSELPLTIGAEGASLVIPATVLWSELTALSFDDEESDRYQCGIEFPKTSSLLAHLINDLVSTRIAVPMEEARYSQRYRVTASLAGRFASIPPSRVLDISIRGARIGTASLLPVGTCGPLRFTLNGKEMPVDVNATVAWARPAERKGRFEAGLRIDGVEDWLKAVIDELSLRGGAVLELNTLRKKFEPVAAVHAPNVVEFMR